MVLRRAIRVLVWRRKLVFVREFAVGLGAELHLARNKILCNFLHSVCRAFVAVESMTVLVDGLDWGTILSMALRKIRSKLEAIVSSSELV